MSYSRRRSPDIPLAAYGAFVRRHAVLLTVTAVLGAVLGVVLGQRITAYVGTTAVMVPPVNLNTQSAAIAGTPTTDKDALTPDTEAQLATSTHVLEAIRTATGLRTPVDLLSERLTIDAPTNTRVLTISFDARRQVNARTGSQAAADAYLAARTRLLTERRNTDLDAIAAQVRGLQARLADATVLTRSGSTSSRVAAATRVASLEAKIRSFHRTANRISTEPLNAGYVLRPAAESPLRAKTSPEVPLTSGLLAGLLAGIVIARVAPRRVVASAVSARSADPNLDVLALPRARWAGLAQMSRRRLTRSTPRPGPAVRRLRNHVVADGGGVSVLCGPVRPAAATALAAGLSRVLARLGEPVALVVDDADVAGLRSLRIEARELREPAAAAAGTAGIPDVFAGVAAYRLPRGPDASAAVTGLARNYRHVIVALPGAPDASGCALARAADRVLVCTERRRTRVRDLRTVLRRLQLVRARVTLTLLIGADRSRPASPAEAFL